MGDSAAAAAAADLCWLFQLDCWFFTAVETDRGLPLKVCHCGLQQQLQELQGLAV
jgi:hypothetical protein